MSEYVTCAACDAVMKITNEHGKVRIQCLAPLCRAEIPMNFVADSLSLAARKMVDDYDEVLKRKQRRMQ